MKLLVYIPLVLFVIFSCTDENQKNTISTKGKKKERTKELKTKEITADSLIPNLNLQFNSKKYHSYQQINFRVDFQLEGEEFLYFDVSILPQSSEVYVKLDSEEQYFMDSTGVKGNKEARLKRELGQNLMKWLQVVQLPYNAKESFGVVTIESGIKRYNMEYTKAEISISEMIRSKGKSAEILMESQTRYLKLIQFESEEWSFKKGTLNANSLAYKNFMTLEGIPFARRISLMHISKEKELVIGEGRIKSIVLLETVDKPFSTRGFKSL